MEKKSTTKPTTASHPLQMKNGKSKKPPGFALNAGPAQMKSGPLQFFGLGGPRSLKQCLDVQKLDDEALKKEIDAIKKWKSENPESDQSDMLNKALGDLEKEQKYRDTYDDVTKSPHKQRGLNNDIGEMVRTMLTAAGYEPDQWYKDFVSINLFGQTCKGIRPEFAALLKDAEKKTLSKLAKEDPKLKDPRLAAKYLGINENYATSRTFRDKNPAYQSMHLFGLAIDINYTNNPWITQEGKNSGTYKSNFKKVVRNMDALFNTDNISGYKHVGANSKQDLEGLEASFDGHSAIDKQMETYYGLLNDDAKLEATLKASKDPKWSKMSLKKAKSIIKKDLGTMAGQSSRKGWAHRRHNGNKEKLNRKQNFAEQGTMDLDKRLVMSMGEVGLDWGGKYGDMMHFDMRFTGVGDKIQKAKYNKDVRKLKKKLKKK